MTLNVDWTVARKGKEKSVMVKKLVLHENADGVGYQDYVAAQSRLLARLRQEIADDAAKAAERHTTQCFEMIGNRGIYHDGWMASVFHKVPWDTGASVPFDKDKWELYNVKEDYSQYNDVATTNPEKLKEMQALFESEGKKFGVFPLDDRLAGRLYVNLRPSWTSSRTHFTFFPGMTHLDEGTAPNVKNKSHSITAEVEIPQKGAEGVLLAMGSGTCCISRTTSLPITMASSVITITRSSRKRYRSAKLL